MNSLLLCHEALASVELEGFHKGMIKLVSINKREEDMNFRHSSLYDQPFYVQVWNPKLGQDSIVFQKYLGQMDVTENYTLDCDQLDQLFPESKNGWLGIDFSICEIVEDRIVVDQDTYESFCEIDISQIDFREIWTKRHEIFDNLELCGEVKHQISRIGNSSLLNQVLQQLKTLDNAVSNWSSGPFPLYDIVSTTDLDISGESKGTMKKYGNQRSFRMPNGGTEVCELHIKTGNLRFHFYADNEKRKIYVGYIGSHLDTVSG